MKEDNSSYDDSSSSPKGRGDSSSITKKNNMPGMKMNYNDQINNGLISDAEIAAA